MRRGAATIASVGDKDCTSLGGIITVVSATVNHGNKFADICIYNFYTMLAHHSQPCYDRGAGRRQQECYGFSTDTAAYLGFRLTAPT